MGEVADKVSTHSFEASQAGKILNEQKTSTRVLIGDDYKLQVLMTCRQFNRLALHLTLLLATSPGLHKLVVANDFCDAAVERIRELKESASGRVSELNQSLCIGDEHAVCDLVENRGKARTFGIQYRILNVKSRYERCNRTGDIFEFFYID